VKVASEWLTVDSRPLLNIDTGNVRLFDDHGEETNSYPQSLDRCLLGSVEQMPPNTRLAEFRDWLADLYVLGIDPAAMKSVTSKEERRPDHGMSNYASWYRHLLQIEPRQINDMLHRIEAVLPGFHSLRLEDVGQNTKLLKAEFKRAADEVHGDGPSFEFAELSDGQRALIALYTMLECSIVAGRTLCIDEPDNFVTLRELQPWINEVIERTEDMGAQVMIISHHPELIDLLANDHGVVFVRDGQAPPRVVPYRPTTEGVLSPSEELARGWDRG
jgi:hypothetical protein